jgi:hypothetical protein
LILTEIVILAMEMAWRGMACWHACFLPSVPSRGVSFLCFLSLLGGCLFALLGWLVGWLGIHKNVGLFFFVSGFCLLCLCDVVGCASLGSRGREEGRVMGGGCWGEVVGKESGSFKVSAG